MIDTKDVVEAIAPHRGDAVVIHTMMAIRYWNQVSQRPDLDIPISNGMSKAVSLGLGIALAQPQRKVIVLDGDGSLLMNLGALVTVAQMAPRNLYHFVFENGIYGITGGQPIPGKDMVSFEGMARAAGYPAAFTFDDLEEFKTRVGEVLSGTAPALVCVKTTPEVENRPINQRPTTGRGMPAAMRDVRRVLTGQPWVPGQPLR